MASASRAGHPASAAEACPAGSADPNAPLRASDMASACSGAAIFKGEWPREQLGCHSPFVTQP